MNDLKPSETVTLALPKGRLFGPSVDFVRSLDLPTRHLEEVDRALLLDESEHNLQYLLVRPSDVVTYVSEGAADLGIVGKDTLLEKQKDVYEVHDLGFGACHVAIAAPRERVAQYESLEAFYRSCGTPIRVATKYPNLAERHFAGRGLEAKVFPLRGSVELGPLVGLSDVILDLVSTGRTLKVNGLVECEQVATITARLIVNSVSLRVNSRISSLVNRARDQWVGAEGGTT